VDWSHALIPLARSFAGVRGFVRATPLALVVATMGVPARGQIPPAPARESAQSVVHVVAGQPACPNLPLTLEPFMELLRIELAAMGMRPVLDSTSAPVPEDEPMRIELAPAPCAAASTRVTITVFDAAIARGAPRTVDLANVVPSARPRTLALEVAETFRGFDESPLARAMERNPPAPPTVRPSSSPHSAVGDSAVGSTTALSPRRSDHVAANSSRLRVDGTAAAEIRWFSTYGTAMLGGRAGTAVTLRLPLILRVRAEIAGATGIARAHDGEIDIRVLAAGAAVLLGLGRDSVRGELGLHVDVGYGWAVGRTIEPDVRVGDGSALIAIGSVVAGVRFALAPIFSVVVELRVGPVLQGLTAVANGRPAAGLSGVAVALAVGASLP